MNHIPMKGWYAWYAHERNTRIAAVSKPTPEIPRGSWLQIASLTLQSDPASITAEEFDVLGDGASC